MTYSKLIITYLVSSLLIILSRPNVLANESSIEGVFLGDINNIAVGAFNSKKDTYLFSIPKDNPPTDRGVIWGEIFMFKDQGKKHPFISFFDCGLVTGHFGPYQINFSKDDKYLVIESGGESGSVIDVFEVNDLYDEPLERGWNGTTECVTPIATVGSYNVPVSFHGWDDYILLVKSSIPLSQSSTPSGVIALEKDGKYCSEEMQVFAWDIIADEFTVVEVP